MSVLLTNLRNHGNQLEALSKDTLDRSFVTFRNASQDERLNIMTRLHLLELIELRAKSWLNSDGVNSYYKHKATNVEVNILFIYLFVILFLFYLLHKNMIKTFFYLHITLKE